MKTFIAAALMLAATSIFAQAKLEGRAQQLSAEQKTELQVKRMTLDLELTEKQQKEIKSLVLEQNQKLEERRKDRDQRREEMAKMTKDERFKMQSQALDDELAFQAKVKKILTDDQYVKWQAQRERRKDIMKSQAKKKMEQRREEKGKK